MRSCFFYAFALSLTPRHTVCFIMKMARKKWNRSPTHIQRQTRWQIFITRAFRICCRSVFDDDGGGGAWWWCRDARGDLPLWICVFALEFTSIDLFAFCTLFILLLDDVVTSWWASAAIRSISFLYLCVRLAVIKQDGDGAHIKFVNWNKKVTKTREMGESGVSWGWCCRWMDERLRWNTQLLFIALVGPSTLANLLMILLYVRRPRTYNVMQLWMS